jgi:hypothetical protein
VPIASTPTRCSLLSDYNAKCAIDVKLPSILRACRYNNAIETARFRLLSCHLRPARNSVWTPGKKEMYNLSNGIGAVNEHDEISINITH